ncbi:MAG: dihydropteroate synthase [Chitinophagaceae bacterium]
MFTLSHHQRVLTVDKPLVMGILNITPDSFYAGSRVQELDELLKKAIAMVQAGATILDLGGQSTRPDSERVSANEEIDRVLPAIKLLHKELPNTFLSIDTYYASVAKESVLAGAFMVNDISAGTLDTAMLTTVASLNVPYVLMHSRGTPSTMQSMTTYSQLTQEVLDFLAQKMQECKALGISDIVIDPGVGFAKTIPQNFQLLRELELFQTLNAPLLIGLSRKSFIYKTLQTSPEQALNGSTFLHAFALQKGASILRVHDVREAAEAIRLYEELKIN